MFSRILVPLDFTDKNLRALEMALEVAEQSRASVALLHVIEVIEHLSAEELRGFYRKLEETARTRLNFPASMFLDKGLVVEPEIVYGRRAEEIVRYAMMHDVDLIILSSHRFRPEQPTQTLGTLSHKVAMLAQCPVLLVK